MICWAVTIDDMIKNLLSMQKVGATHVVIDHSMRDRTTGASLDIVQMELVYMTPEYELLGEEANDYPVSPGDIKAVKIS